MYCFSVWVPGTTLIQTKTKGTCGDELVLLIETPVLWRRQRYPPIFCNHLINMNYQKQWFLYVNLKGEARRLTTVDQKSCSAADAKVSSVLPRQLRHQIDDLTLASSHLKKNNREFPRIFPRIFPFSLTMPSYKPKMYKKKPKITKSIYPIDLTAVNNSANYSYLLPSTLCTLGSLNLLFFFCREFLLRFD